MSFTKLLLPITARLALSRTTSSAQCRRAHLRTFVKPLVLASATAITASFVFVPTIHLDASIESTETYIDPATSIAFPTTLRVPAKFPLPPFSLIGVGVRTVSFLGIKVYSVGFYADMSNPRLDLSRFSSPDEKIKHIVNNTACVIRIIPTRSTSFSHLRDAFMRSLYARISLSKKNGTLLVDEEQDIQSPLRKLKSIFPSTTFAKHTPLDILLTAPSATSPRTLIIRDLGAVESDWVSREFVLAYFEGEGPSPALKKSVVERLELFERGSSAS